MNAHQLIHADWLFLKTSGIPSLRVGLIDGPVALDHPDLERKNIELVAGKHSGACSIAHSGACQHGTQVAGILSSKRKGKVPGFCPGCTLLIKPIFPESRQTTVASDSAMLSAAILQQIDAGAKVINLSLGLDISDFSQNDELVAALDQAAARQVLIVAAAGNQSSLVSTELTRHGWVIPVVAFDQNGAPMDLSNFSASIGRNGIGAPGEEIPTLMPTGQYGNFGGTSAATPFVTGTIALLWSLFPQKSALQIREAILMGSGKRRRSVVPPLLNARLAYEYLKNT